MPGQPLALLGKSNVLLTLLSSDSHTLYNRTKTRRRNDDESNPARYGQPHIHEPSTKADPHPQACQHWSWGASPSTQATKGAHPKCAAKHCTCNVRPPEGAHVEELAREKCALGVLAGASELSSASSSEVPAAEASANAPPPLPFRASFFASSSKSLFLSFWFSSDSL